MQIRSLVIAFVIVLSGTLLSPSARAMTDEQQTRFDQVYAMNMTELTETAADLLARKYPDEDWQSYRFPDFVFTNRSVEIGYKIAVKEPELLGRANLDDKRFVIPCYCFCDSMGHANLLHCFWKEGRVGGEFDIHAAGCNICYGQAMQAFLWNDIGASHAEIIAGMEKKYQRLIQMKKEGKF